MTTPNVSPELSIQLAIARKDAEAASINLAEERRRQRCRSLCDWLRLYGFTPVAGGQLSTIPGLNAVPSDGSGVREKPVFDGFMLMRTDLVSLMGRLPVAPGVEWNDADPKFRALLLIELGMVASADGFQRFCLEGARRMTAHFLSLAFNDYHKVLSEDPDNYSAPEVVEDGTENQRCEWIRGHLGIPPSQWSIYRGWLELVKLVISAIRREFAAVQFNPGGSWEQVDSFGYALRRKLRQST